MGDDLRRGINVGDGGAVYEYDDEGAGDIGACGYCGTLRRKIGGLGGGVPYPGIGDRGEGLL